MTQTRKGTILVADDEPHLRRLARKVLESRGHRVLLAADGEECVALFREHADSIDLVFLDFSMPGRTGDVALADLRGIRGDVKVVLCSGHEAAEVAPGLDRASLFGLLRKPYVVQRLLDEVERALAGAD